MNRKRVARLAEDKRGNHARRIAARDYPRLLKHVLENLFPDSSHRTEAIQLLAGYGSSPQEPQPDRVRLAILKLAGADLARLRSTVDGAKQDYEDILSWAESPRATQLHIGNHRLTADRAADVAAKDRHEYEDWLSQPHKSSNQSLEPTADRSDE